MNPGSHFIAETETIVTFSWLNCVSQNVRHIYTQMQNIDSPTTNVYDSTFASTADIAKPDLLGPKQKPTFPLELSPELISVVVTTTADTLASCNSCIC